ncbi:hypothetical protein PG997_014772 [Apiospora hydei]|uniref:DUF6546 domain-containing protein n=1 Tax=Apiospora hydei TaxID=1337664 RepID=A0ABR1UXA7_9PEZI
MEMEVLPKLWEALSPEIKLQIFGHLASQNLSENAANLRVAPLATVNKEWQKYFESITFQSLTLQQYHVAQLQTMVSPHPRRVEAVRHIHLRLELPRYFGANADKPETKKEVKVSDTIFNKATRKLFSIVSRWPANPDQECVFEISAHSPSDFQARFERMQYYANNTLFHFRPNNPRDHEGDTEPIPAWAEEEWFLEMNGPQIGYYEPTRASKDRVVGSGLCSTMKVAKFAAVKKFDAFILRRQFFRTFAAGGGINVILDAMPNLRSFTYEPWHGMTEVDCELQDEGYCELFRCLSGHEKLQNVTIFKSFEAYLSHDYRYARTSLPTPDPVVGYQAAVSSSQADAVTTLNLCFVTDAMDFFRSFWNPEQFPPEPPLILPSDEMRWAKLEKLVLTSDALRRDGDHNNLVCIAADAAKNMPRLAVMRVWNCGDRHCAYILYTRDLYNLSSPKLRLGSTWGFKLSENANDQWESVVEVHQCRYPLAIKYIAYKKDHMRCYTSLTRWNWTEEHDFPNVATNTTLKEMRQDEKHERY